MPTPIISFEKRSVDKKLRDGRGYWRLKCGHIRMFDIRKVRKDEKGKYHAHCVQCDTSKVVDTHVDFWQDRSK